MTLSTELENFAQAIRLAFADGAHLLGPTEWLAGLTKHLPADAIVAAAPVSVPPPADPTNAPAAPVVATDTATAPAVA